MEINSGEMIRNSHRHRDFDMVITFDSGDKVYLEIKCDEKNPTSSEKIEKELMALFRGDDKFSGKNYDYTVCDRGNAIVFAKQNSTKMCAIESEYGIILCRTLLSSPDYKCSEKDVFDKFKESRAKRDMKVAGAIEQVNRRIKTAKKKVNDATSSLELGEDIILTSCGDVFLNPRYKVLILN